MKIKSLFTLLAIIIAFYSCNSGSKTNSETKEVVEQTVKEIDAVCVWDKGSIKDSPGGDYVTRMALGEKITWLGITKSDTTKKGKVVNYHKVILSDGTEGWASEYVIVTEAKPGVIRNEATVYDRPNLINSTDDKFEAMDFVAIKKTENNWCEIVGEKNNPKGWVQLASVSTKDYDIAVALLAGKAFAEEDEEVKKEKITEIIENSAFANSAFIEFLKTEIEEEEEITEETAVEETELVDSISE